MYGKSNMETYITICKIDSQWEFAVWLRKLKQGLCINLEGWDGEGDGREVQEGGHICMPMADSCGCLIENTQFCKAIILQLKNKLGFPGGSAGKEPTCNAEDLGSIPGLGRSPGEGKGYPLPDSGLENSMDCVVHGIAKSQT